VVGGSVEVVDHIRELEDRKAVGCHSGDTIDEARTHIAREADTHVQR
jgi:hypothetical protein